MIDFFLLKKILIALILPPTGLLLLTLVGLAVIRRRPRLGRAFAYAGVVMLLVLSVPMVARALLDTLDETPPLDYAQARTAQAIVILGGGVRRNALEYGGDTVGRLTLERVRYGAWVAKRTGLPVLVTGGAPYGGRTEAELMRAALQDEFGVPVRWVEPASRNTHENAVYSAAILKPAGVTRVVLVGHSFDMARAQAEFAASGLDTVLAPTLLLTRDDDTPVALLLMPSLSALQGSYYALYELLAGLAQRLGLNG